MIWLNKETDDPGFGKTVIYDNNKYQRILSIDLLKTIVKLNQNSLVYQVLRPLLAKNETEVRQKLVDWVEAIHQNNLAADTEQRLILLLTQIIEQKFKTLSYQELEAMLRLTPFKETLSYREALQEDLQSYSIDMLTEQIARKFKFAQSTVSRLQQRLRQLSLDDLKALFGDIIEMERLAEINAWLDDRLEQVKHE